MKRATLWHRLGLTACAALLKLFIASPSSAVDGVIEINQAKVLAGGITAGDSAGFPATISQAGSYRLTGNLDVSGLPTPENVTAVSITMADVRLDLNGFMIKGPTTCTGIPVTSCSPTGGGAGITGGGDRITISNGTITGMGNSGINLSSSQYVRVEGVTSTQNGAQGIVVGFGSVIDGNNASVNGMHGIRVGGGSSVTRNLSHGNKNSGVQDNGGGTIITGNSIKHNAGFGLDLAVAGGGGIGYGSNVLACNNSAGVCTNGTQVNAGADTFQIGMNVCGSDTTCP